MNTSIVKKYFDSLGNKTNKFFIFSNQRQKGKTPSGRIHHLFTVICRKENTMKKSIVLSALFCMISVSVALADSTVGGSVTNEIQGDTITNSSTGTESKANLGAVIMEESKVGGSVMNRVVGKTITNTATGAQSEANLGVVNIQNSRVSGSVVNNIEGKNLTNLAIGTGSEANIGTVKTKMK
jgi:hypothetical protein